MKKLIIRTICFTLPWLGFSACNDFLDERPQSDFTQEGSEAGALVSEYLSISDAQAELQGAYNSFKNDIYQLENYTINDIQSDNCYAGSDGVYDIEEDLHKITATNYKKKIK